MTLIGVTGGIGCGKSTLVKQFLALGASVSDADEIAHNVYLPGNEAFEILKSHWGNSVLASDGTIDRKRVATIVFTDKKELEWLNNVLHPFIRQEIARLAKETLHFCAIPLLYETGWDKPCDCIVAAWCDKKTQLQRLRLRGWDDEEIARRIKSQIPMDEKFLRSDYGIITSCSWQHLHQQCEHLLEILKKRYEG